MELSSERLSGSCRVLNSRRLKEQIISDIVRLRDERDVIEEDCGALQDKVRRLAKRNVNLQDRVKRMACRVELRSPVLSEAEQCMMKELEGFSNHFKKMDVEIRSVCIVCKSCHENWSI